MEILSKLREFIANVSLNVLDIMNFTDEIIKQLGKSIGIEFVIYVSDLIRCVLRTVISRWLIKQFGIEQFRKWYISRTLSIMDIDGIVIGYLLQYGLEKIQNELKLSKTENVKRKIINLNGVEFVISGKPDFEIIENGITIPVEIKFSKKEIDKPMPYHVIQCGLYAWLYNVNYCKLIIFTPFKNMEFTINSFNNEFINTLFRNWISKAPLWKNECLRCIYSEFCSNELKTCINKRIKNIHDFVNFIKNFNLDIELLSYED